jgi:chromosome segregation ATPase
MEVDILNEIVTLTVSSLFSRGLRTQPQPTPPPQVEPALTPQAFVQQVGPTKLAEALNRLRLDHGAASGRELVSKSYEELTVEKKKVKNELKLYDTLFKDKFLRLPKREEKEPMRPLYMYYKRLKQALTRRATERPTVVDDSTTTRLTALRSERADLRVRLHSFQNDFSRTHNRRIRYHRDIEPVEAEYKRYKEVKQEIARLEGVRR